MRYTLSLLVLLALLLSACSAIKAIDPAVPTATNPAPATETVAPTEPEPSVTPALPASAPIDTASAGNPPAGQDLARTDGQGAVEMEVTPSNLTNPGETLDFEVGLNTHSVNLNMDLAALATLKTDTGLSVNASSWNGESGGHHVSGSLTFPARVDGKSLLEGAKVLTLVIKNVAAPERTFSWNLQP